ncbi:MAG: S-methyl-5-thioribose-1-phosphate isomerase [Candidatus Aminicenantes bacterium]|nr:S-methyl-5-thioribose-1-phosphate isomerase [Candidatus Aminicenantes bacterium]
MRPVIWWKNGRVVMIDQRQLPGREVYIECKNHERVARAIETLAIRGAPAIGVAAAYGVALGVSRLKGGADLDGAFAKIHKRLWRTRPTARNLFWALERMKAVYEKSWGLGLAALKKRLLAEAAAIDREDVMINRKLGRNGSALIKSGSTVLTHCNAGALATAGYGTALGVVRAAVERGKKVRVVADETRPVLQGARLTVWELARDRIPVTLITDNMAAYLMARGEIDLVIVGADRIARNGDTANKIGTYGVAVLAKEHEIPFYVAAPLSTVDLGLKDGSGIPIEERSGDEVRRIRGKLITLPKVDVRNPAFDVTPAKYITAIITERGIARPPLARSLGAWIRT